MDIFQELFGKAPVDEAGEIKHLIDKKGMTEEVIPPMGPEDRVRASGIGQFCPRFEALRHRDGIHLREKVKGRLNRIFADGRTFERALRDKVFGPLGILVGAWVCTYCGQRYGEMGPKLATLCPKTCVGCQRQDGITYVEPMGLVDPTKETCHLGGSADGFIQWKGEVCLLEIKTCKDQFWRNVAKLGSPMAHHISQTQIYLQVFNLRRSLHWYYNKNTSEHLPIWTSKSEDHVEKMVAKARALNQYFKTEILPDRMCVNETCGRAKLCELKTLCFSGP